MQEPSDYSIIFQELERIRKEDPSIILELGQDKTQEWDSINELREIVSRLTDAPELLFTTT